MSKDTIQCVDSVGASNLNNQISGGFQHDNAGERHASSRVWHTIGHEAATGLEKASRCPQSAAPTLASKVCQGTMSVGKMSTKDDWFAQLATENKIL